MLSTGLEQSGLAAFYHSLYPVFSSRKWENAYLRDDEILYLKCLTQACLPGTVHDLPSVLPSGWITLVRGEETQWLIVLVSDPLSWREMLCLCPAKCANPEDYRYYLPIFMVTVAFDLVKNGSALRQGGYLSPGASHSPKGLQQQRHSPSSFVPLMVVLSKERTEHLLGLLWLLWVLPLQTFPGNRYLRTF